MLNLFSQEFGWSWFSRNDCNRYWATDFADQHVLSNLLSTICICPLVLFLQNHAIQWTFWHYSNGNWLAHFLGVYVSNDFLFSHHRQLFIYLLHLEPCLLINFLGPSQQRFSRWQCWTRCMTSFHISFFSDFRILPLLLRILQRFIK